MVFSTKLGSDLELIITRSKFDPVDIKKKLDFYKERRRLTLEEYNYLVELMEKKVDESVQEHVKEVKQ